MGRIIDRPWIVGGEVGGFDFGSFGGGSTNVQVLGILIGLRQGGGALHGSAGLGTTFVPFTADLSGAAGHMVPARFWNYINRADLFPGGWLHDIGLPISEAQTVRVTKTLPSGAVERTITVQAFPRTILTDGPQNPPDWQVERANVGTDYRKAFPERVGP